MSNNKKKELIKSIIENKGLTEFTVEFIIKGFETYNLDYTNLEQLIEEKNITQGKFDSLYDYYDGGVKEILESLGLIIINQSSHNPSAKTSSNLGHPGFKSVMVGNRYALTTNWKHGGHKTRSRKHKSHSKKTKTNRKTKHRRRH